MIKSIIRIVQVSSKNNPPFFAIDFHRGGRLVFYPSLIALQQCESIATEVYHAQDAWKVHKLTTQNGIMDEPRCHFLLNRKRGLGYKYSKVNMKARPLEDFPQVEKLEGEMANHFGTEFEVGVKVAYL